MLLSLIAVLVLKVTVVHYLIDSKFETSVQVLAIRSQSTLIVAEHNNEKLNAATLHAVTAAGQLGGEVGEVVPAQIFDCFQVNCLVAGTGCAAVAKEVAAVSGVSKVRN